jgi:hypothetical protein
MTDCNMKNILGNMKKKFCWNTDIQNVLKYTYAYNVFPGISSKDWMCLCP